MCSPADIRSRLFGSSYLLAVWCVYSLCWELKLSNLVLRKAKTNPTSIFLELKHTLTENSKLTRINAVIQKYRAGGLFRSRLFEKAVVSTSPHFGSFSLLHTPMDRKRLPASRALHEYEFQRAYKACVPCARRKVKCELGEDEKCLRCTKKRIDCIFTSKKPWSRVSKDGQSSRRRGSLHENHNDLQRLVAIYHMS